MAAALLPPSCHLLDLQRMDLARFVRSTYRMPAEQARFACQIHTP
ncbi:MAG: hypothetical protein QOG11_281 [Solirubrobacteraceae bacterium]|jgi:hypothetical protein|nr:hypothetical protein [Solirubrobacteraceae bacterium]